ncbi:uncharacterized protein SOCG_01145 [Schizosaccharomyces octosporus yFS286]|uniref:SnoaL-like domain-containing protein n=1 Tax=Schizosaccharomyces octosporus (strain yFS286) TaxID=483514 RepID=S9Q5Q8_SCHOY|nr:uncharacterized protein SOCG_01145 [Schizosaccharomyces octosporus yFS286]EPX75397.1 hypothetical protein SOCG_01145 [Schizosaccharomyces octosporus yFS286]
MSVPALPVTLAPALSGRDAVADALYRAVVALDTADDALFKSAFTTDAVLDPMLYHAHQIGHQPLLSNMRINITEGDSKAQVTCSALSQHYRGGEGMNPSSDFLLAGGLYWVELVKDSGDGLWKIKHWTLKSTWGQGDWGILGK